MESPIGEVFGVMILVFVLFASGMTLITWVIGETLGDDWKCTQYTEWRISDDSQSRDCVQFTKQQKGK